MKRRSFAVGLPLAVTSSSLALAGCGGGTVTPLAAAPIGAGTYEVGEIRYYSGGVIPSGWMQSSGQSLATASYPALFQVLGKRFGGDGVTTFHLPNFRHMPRIISLVASA